MIWPEKLKYLLSGPLQEKFAFALEGGEGRPWNNSYIQTWQQIIQTRTDQKVIGGRSPKNIKLMNC